MCEGSRTLSGNRVMQAFSMFSGNYQVVDVLMLVGNVAPIALYFLTLGLVNSHSRPCLVTARADFVALTGVLVPVLLWPVPSLAHGRLIWMLAAAFLLAACMFVYMLSKRHAGFVLYNVAEHRCVKLLEDSLAALAIRGTWNGSVWQSIDGRLTIHLRSFALLRNVSLNIETDDDPIALTCALEAQLTRRFGQIAQLPSTMGACLVMLGVVLMILPMWMMGRHIHDLVDAMSHLFG
jgi:hypothetical protein